jgi:hypothetical protein
MAFLTSACGGDDDSADAGASSETDAGDDSSDTDDGGDDGDDAGDTPNPCELITLAEMETAFGFAWSEGEYSPPDIAPIASCSWSDADPGMPAKVVSLSIGTDAGFEDKFGQSVKKVYEDTKALVEPGDILEDDLGLGDDSYRTDGGIYVLDGDTSYTFSTLGGLSDEAAAGLRAMATKVVNG